LTKGVKIKEYRWSVIFVPDQVSTFGYFEFDLHYISVPTVVF